MSEKEALILIKAVERLVNTSNYISVEDILAILNIKNQGGEQHD